MAILSFNINRTPKNLGKTEQERILVSDFSNEKDALKLTLFKAKNLKNAGYIVTITVCDNNGEFKFFKKI